MRAVLQDGYGGPEVLSVGEIPRPEPGPGEVLVRVGAASLHADVWHVLSGRPWLITRLVGLALRRPKNPVPGIDLAGEVVALGEGVSALTVGSEVFGEICGGYQWRNSGAFAEYVVAPEKALVTMPSALSFAEAACIPTSGLIALVGLRDELRVADGDRVLVVGAGGAVGSFAIQIARALGAKEVVGVDAAAKHDLLRRLGCDRVIDYETENPYAETDRYDKVLDVVGSARLSDLRRVIAPGGACSITGHDRFGADGKRLLGSVPRVIGLLALSPFIGVLAGLRLPKDSLPDRLELLRRMTEEGQIVPPLDRVYPLEDVRTAIADLMAGQISGKAVMSPL